MRKVLSRALLTRDNQRVSPSLFGCFTVVRTYLPFSDTTELTTSFNLEYRRPFSSLSSPPLEEDVDDQSPSRRRRHFHRLPPSYSSPSPPLPLNGADPSFSDPVLSIHRPPSSHILRRRIGRIRFFPRRRLPLSLKCDASPLGRHLLLSVFDRSGRFSSGAASCPVVPSSSCRRRLRKRTERTRQRLTAVVIPQLRPLPRRFICHRRGANPPLFDPVVLVQSKEEEVTSRTLRRVWRQFSRRQGRREGWKADPAGLL